MSIWQTIVENWPMVLLAIVVGFLLGQDRRR